MKRPPLLVQEHFSGVCNMIEICAAIKIKVLIIIKLPVFVGAIPAGRPVGTYNNQISNNLQPVESDAGKNPIIPHSVIPATLLSGNPVV